MGQSAPCPWCRQWTLSLRWAHQFGRRSGRRSHGPPRLSRLPALAAPSSLPSKWHLRRLLFTHDARPHLPVTQDPSLKPASLSAPPFSLRRTAQRSGPVRVTVTLHLHDAADPEHRTQRLSYTAELQAGLGSRESLRQQRYEFPTQRVEYGVRPSGTQDTTSAAGSLAARTLTAQDRGEEASVAEAAAAAVVPQAVAKPALTPGCPLGSPQQQPKKQRVA